MAPKLNELWILITFLIHKNIIFVLSWLDTWTYLSIELLLLYRLVYKMYCCFEIRPYVQIKNWTRLNFRFQCLRVQFSSTLILPVSKTFKNACFGNSFWVSFSRWIRQWNLFCPRLKCFWDGACIPIRHNGREHAEIFSKTAHHRTKRTSSASSAWKLS